MIFCDQSDATLSTKNCAYSITKNNIIPFSMLANLERFRIDCCVIINPNAMTQHGVIQIMNKTDPKLFCGEEKQYELTKKNNYKNIQQNLDERTYDPPSIYSIKTNIKKRKKNLTITTNFYHFMFII
eukprot:275663_1